MFIRATYKKELIFFLIFLILNLASAQTIQLEYPEKIEVNKEFTININLVDFPEDSYDVKIDINSESRIAQILNNGQWKSTFYYINDAISTRQDFKLKIIKDFQTANIIIKIRNSKESIYTFEGYQILKSEKTTEIAQQEQEEIKDNQEIGEETDEEEPEKQEKVETKAEEKTENKIQTISLIEESQPTETIRLNSEAKEIYKSNNQIIKDNLIIILSPIIPIVLLYFLTTKTKKHKKTKQKFKETEENYEELMETEYL